MRWWILVDEYWQLLVYKIIRNIRRERGMSYCTSGSWNVIVIIDTYVEDERDEFVD